MSQGEVTEKVITFKLKTFWALVVGIVFYTAIFLNLYFVVKNDVATLQKEYNDLKIEMRKIETNVEQLEDTQNTIKIDMAIIKEQQHTLLEVTKEIKEILKKN